MATNNGAVVSRTHTTSTRSTRKPASRRRKPAKSRRETRGGLAVRAQHAAQETWEGLRDSGAAYVARGQKKVRVAEGKVKRFIREQPLKSALICTSLALAAGAGLWLGRIWSRRELQRLIKHSPWQ